MAIFKLQTNGDDISNAELIEASKTNIDLELYLESWLEKSPWAIAQEPLIWIGRQTSTISWYENKIDFADALHLAFSRRCVSFAAFAVSFIKKVQKLSSMDMIKP
jgi:hypothetical protein